MDLLLFLFFIQIFYLTIKYGPMQNFLNASYKPTVNKLTKKQVRTYLIPIIGIFFILKDWYKSLED